MSEKSVQPQGKSCSATSRRAIDQDLLALMFSDAKCYRKLMINLHQLHRERNDKTYFGETSAYDSLILMLTLDISIFADSAMELLIKTKGINIKLDEISQWPGFESRIRSVRNAMHLYNKFGSYEPRAQKSLTSQKMMFQTQEVDFLYPLRSDESFTYEITDGFRYLSGAQFLFANHVLDNRTLSWTGDDIYEYSRNLNMLVKFLIDISEGLDSNIESFVFSANDICIENFDDKLENVLCEMPVSDITAVRVMLVFTRLSNALFINRILFEGSQIRESIVWLIFYIRWLSMYIDEALDSMDNLLKHSKTSEKEYLARLHKQLNSEVSSELRSMIQDARNLIHYDNKEHLAYTADESSIDITRPFYYQLGLFSYDKISDLYASLVRSLYSMQKCLRLSFGKKGQIRL